MRAELTAIFEKLIAELPSGVAELRIRDLPKHMGSAIELMPMRSASAPCGVVFDDWEVYSFSFGARSYWEFPYERRYRKNEKTEVEEIEELARSVIAGNCEEERGWFSMAGRIRVSGYTYITTNIPMVPIPPFFLRRYEPYV